MRSLLFILLLIACSGPDKNQVRESSSLNCGPYEIYIDDSIAMAAYYGPEFLNGEDIGHQLSNFVADSVGSFLKKSFEKKNYQRVVLDSIKVNVTVVSGDTVKYSVVVPFEKSTRCEANTCIDHRGSWVNNRFSTDVNHRIFIKKLKEAGYCRIKSKLFTSGTLYEYWAVFSRSSDVKGCQ